MAKTLLQQAREVVLNRRNGDSFSKEELELTKAWLVGEINLTQVIKALGTGKGTGNIYTFLARSARQLWQQHFN